MFPEAFHILLPLYSVAALGLALVYLRRRRMSTRAHALWGIFALLVPVLGPFLVIAVQPGRRPRPRPVGDEPQPARRSQSPRRFSPR
jgi:hypothetical protein